MGFFKKIFGKKEAEFAPDNSVLLALLQSYHQNPTNETYGKVLEELYGPRAFLVVPTANEGKGDNEWKMLKKNESISFTTVFNVDGMKVFGVFTSSEALSKWITTETSYMAMPAKNVLEISEQNQFNRVVIDSDQDTMFVLERNREHIKTEVVEKDTEVQVGYPSQPIDGENNKQLQKAFALNINIDEVYHFMMHKNGENVLILAFVLSNYSENARLAILDCISDGMYGHELSSPLDIMYIDVEDSWYTTAKQFELFYKRN